MFQKDIGIDLGTANTLVYMKGRGIIMREPSVVAVDTKTDELRVRSVGHEAKAVIGRAPGSIVAVRPLKDGVIADFDVTAAMLQSFIRQACGRGIFSRPRVVICVPSGVTEVERRAVRQAAMRAGARQVMVIEEPMAAAIGAGLPTTEPVGSMIVDIGGGTAEVAVISLSGIVASQSIRCAGDTLDQSIIAFIKRKYNLLVGERTAEQIKIEIGSAAPMDPEATMEVKGRNLVDGLPKDIVIRSEEVREAMSESLLRIVDAIKDTLERTPARAVQRHHRPGHHPVGRRRAAAGVGPAGAERDRHRGPCGGKPAGLCGAGRRRGTGQSRAGRTPAGGTELSVTAFCGGAAQRLPRRFSVPGSPLAGFCGMIFGRIPTKFPPAPAGARAVPPKLRILSGGVIHANRHIFRPDRPGCSGHSVRLADAVPHPRRNLRHCRRRPHPPVPGKPHPSSTGRNAGSPTARRSRVIRWIWCWWPPRPPRWTRPQRRLPPLWGRDTAIVSVINGIASEEKLDALYPGRVLWSVALGMDATRTGRTLVCKARGCIQLGERDGSLTPRLQAVADYLTGCGIRVEVCTDILTKQWQKLMMNVGLNQASAVFDLTYGGLRQPGPAQDAMMQAMHEVTAVAAKKGIALSDDAPEVWLRDMMPRFAADAMPSMRQDVLAHRPTEVEEFAGVICRLGRQYGVPTPVNDYFYRRLQEIQQSW